MLIFLTQNYVQNQNKKNQHTFMQPKSFIHISFSDWERGLMYEYIRFEDGRFPPALMYKAHYMLLTYVGRTICYA